MYPPYGQPSFNQQHNPFYQDGYQLRNDPLTQAFHTAMSHYATDPVMGPQVMFLLNVLVHKRDMVISSPETLVAISGIAFLLSVNTAPELLRPGLEHVVELVKVTCSPQAPSDSTGTQIFTISDR